MKRSALSDFLRGLVIAALPAAATGCCSDHRQIVHHALTFPIAVEGTPPAVGDGLPQSVCDTECNTTVPHQFIKKIYSCSVGTIDATGITSVDCDEEYQTCTGFLPGGRPPLGLRPRRAVDARDPVGAFFAAMAHVEAAAVDGFEELARALAAHGAPDVLVAAARDAAADEARHARVAAAFARRFGAAALPPVEIDAVAAPSLETLALANAREGCVLETYGAVVTEWQSRTARDRAVRRAFVNIAADELRHAELAFAVARWLHPRLDDLARRRVRDARRAAAAELARDLERPTPPRLVAAVGLPASDAARDLVADLRARLWT
ncbi:MAG TPA: hypothetical protein VF334_10740 [Polyangia bacterium]